MKPNEYKRFRRKKQVSVFTPHLAIIRMGRFIISFFLLLLRLLPRVHDMWVYDEICQVEQNEEHIVQHHITCTRGTNHTQKKHCENLLEDHSSSSSTSTSPLSVRDQWWWQPEVKQHEHVIGPSSLEVKCVIPSHPNKKQEGHHHVLPRGKPKIVEVTHLKRMLADYKFPAKAPSPVGEEELIHLDQHVHYTNVDYDSSDEGFPPFFIG